MLLWEGSQEFRDIVAATACCLLSLMFRCRCCAARLTYCFIEDRYGFVQMWQVGRLEEFVPSKEVLIT